MRVIVSQEKKPSRGVFCQAESSVRSAIGEVGSKDEVKADVSLIKEIVPSGVGREQKWETIEYGRPLAAGTSCSV